MPTIIISSYHHSCEDVPSVDTILLEKIEDFKAENYDDDKYVGNPSSSSRDGGGDDRRLIIIIYLADFQPQWLKEEDVAMRIVAEFPGGFPRNNNNNNNNYSYAVSAILMEIPPGAYYYYYYEQEWHICGWISRRHSLFIPLTNHRGAQGTTAVFHGGVYPQEEDVGTTTTTTCSTAECCIIIIIIMDKRTEARRSTGLLWFSS